MALFDLPVIVRGGGDLGSGVAYRLSRAGFPVVILELDRPLLVRPGVSYGAAVFSGSLTVEGITARCVPLAALSREMLTSSDSGEILVAVDPTGLAIGSLAPPILVDARMAKRNLGTRIDDAPLVIGMGPGFTAGLDCHAVIETNRGHSLGRLIRQGSAEPDTGTPGIVDGRGHERVLRAPRAGYVTRQRSTGDFIREGEPIAFMDELPLVAPFDGVLRGLIHETVFVEVGLKIGDLDPRVRREHCFTHSDKALAIGGAALEAVFSSPAIRARLQ